MTQPSTGEAGSAVGIEKPNVLPCPRELRTQVFPP